MADHYAVPDGGECKVSALIHPRSSPGSPLSPRPNSAAPAAKSARAGGPQHLAAARFVVGGQPMAVSGVDPRTIGLNKWSVWRLQGWLGSLMSTCIAAKAAVVLTIATSRTRPEGGLSVDNARLMRSQTVFRPDRQRHNRHTGGDNQRVLDQTAAGLTNARHCALTACQRQIGKRYGGCNCR